MDLVEKGVIYLLSHEGTFFAEFFIRARREEGELPPGALMAMSVRNGRLYLHTNLKVIAHLTVEQVARGLMHEALHWFMEHGARCAGRQHAAWNVAGDLAINCLIDGMDIGLIPGKPGQFESWPRDKEAEYYYDKLPRSAKQGGGGGKCNGNCKPGKGKPDAGDGTCTCNPNCSGARKEMSDFDKEVVRRNVQEAKEAHTKAHGSMPSNIEQVVNDFLQPPKVDWKTVLRQYVAASIKAEQNKTWRKENRRGLPLKGAQRIRRARIIVALDTSGSIFSDMETLGEFYSEIRGIQKVYRADIEVIECDAEVSNTYKLKKTSKMPTPTGGGGTAFGPVFEYIIKHKMKADLLIYLTDLYGSFPEKETIRTLWLVCSGGGDKVPFGRMIKITKGKGGK